MVSRKFQQPAKRIVDMLGGPNAVAKWLALTPGAVSKWYVRVEDGGCAGLVPSKHIPSLCRLAKVHDTFLEPNMFFDGHL
jgi:hypothetical protein